MNRRDKIRPSVCEAYTDRVANVCLQNKEFVVSVLFCYYLGCFMLYS